MAWTHSYGTITSGNALTLMPIIRDFMVSAGWTIADDFTSLSEPFFAMRSTGEDGVSPFAVMFEKYNASELLLPTVCKTWETVAGNFWTPSPGVVACDNGGRFTASGGAPSFTDYFAPGDTFYVFNTGNGNPGTNVGNNGRCKVNTVTSTVLQQVTTGYPYNNSPYTNNNRVMLTKGGPYAKARSQYEYGGGGGGILCTSGTYYYFLYGDKDSIIIVTRIGTSYNYSYIGKYIPYHEPVIGVSTSAATAGTTKSINVSDASLYKVGWIYQISNGKNAHMFTVTSIVGNTLYFTGGLLNGVSGTVYPIGSEIGEDVFPYVLCGGTAENQSLHRCVGDYYTPVYNDNSLDNRGAAYMKTRLFSSYFLTGLNPDKRRNQYGFIPWVIYNTYDIRGQLRNLFALTAQLANSEDTIRTENTNGDVYKMFQITDGFWAAIKE